MQLTFVRHAKSDWGDEFLKDIDRPLNSRGYDDAYAQSRWYKESEKTPDLLLASTATRALNTALIFARTLDLNMEKFKIDKSIYESSVDNLILLIKQLDTSKKNVMLFGHNPGITNICNELADDLFFDNIPTCGMVSLQFEIDSWAELKKRNGKLNFQRFPKEFKNRD